MQIIGEKFERERVCLIFYQRLKYRFVFWPIDMKKNDAATMKSGDSIEMDVYDTEEGNVW